MQSALLLYSRKGICKDTIDARSIRSREHARKLWPLLDLSGQFIVTWVSPSFDANTGKFKRRSHFRHLPRNYYQRGLRQNFEREEIERKIHIGESDEHKKAKRLLVNEIQRRIQNSESMPWFFHDPDASEFHFEGDLLFGAIKVESELDIKTQFGCSYRLDIGIIAPPLPSRTKEYIIGGIEIEYEHSFDGRKGLIGRSLGFPLISIDISGMTLEDLSPQWAENIISKTTIDDHNGLRKTFIYLPTPLYPLYIQTPNHIDIGKKHQYIAFTDSERLQWLYKYLKELIKILEYSKDTIALTILNAKSEQAVKQLQNAGEIVGDGWQRFNTRQCLRISLPRPAFDDDIIRNHIFHFNMIRLFLMQEVLLGYKYNLGSFYEDHASDIWTFRAFDPSINKACEYRLLPKRLSMPIAPILKFIDKIKSETKSTDDL